MNPIAHHNALAAIVEAQKGVLEHYEQRLAEALKRAEAAEQKLAAIEKEREVSE